MVRIAFTKKKKRIRNRDLEESKRAFTLMTSVRLLYGDSRSGQMHMNLFMCDWRSNDAWRGKKNWDRSVKKMTEAVSLTFPTFAFYETMPAELFLWTFHLSSDSPALIR